MAVKGAITIEKDRCKGCGICIDACPHKVIDLSKDLNLKGYPYAYMAQPQLCTGCENCGIVCPDGVITVYRVKI